MQANRRISRVLMGLALAAVACFAGAQPVQVATGGKDGTYSRMLAQMGSRCATATPLIESNTSGSMEALDKLMENQVSLAFVQTDVLHLRARTEDVGQIKTLVALHPEQVHIVAREDQPLKSGGIAGFGGKSRPVTELSDLAGQNVGAAGGSYVTAQVMRLQSEVPFGVTNFDSNSAALKALDAGQVKAIIMVGGAPFPTVAALGKPYKLVAIAPATVEKLKGVYKPARLTYAKLGAAGVPTVATEAVLATRDYKTARMADALLNLRRCVVTNLDDLKERTGTHPAWQHVSGDNKGKWAWYDPKGNS